MSTKCIAEHEIEKFRRLQRHWWNPTGPLRSLHLFNPVRVQFINEAVSHYGSAGAGALSFLPGGNALAQGCRVLDVGCGGGILSESLARLGAAVTGIDACAESIAVAQQRRAQVEAAGRAFPQLLNYRHTSLFDVDEEFDVVVATEVIEHVDDARAFLEALCRATRPGGLLILSTMDKSLRTAVSHIALAEHLTGVVEPGTHDWAKFIPPQSLSEHAQRYGVRQVRTSYIATYPDVFRSVATADFQIGFKLTNAVNTGHYFWAGLKSAPAAPPSSHNSSSTAAAPQASQ